MSEPLKTLENFVEPTPVCQQGANLEQVLDCFLRTDCQKIAVVNRNNFPIGAIEFNRLLPDLLERMPKKLTEENYCNWNGTKGKIFGEGTIDPSIRKIVVFSARTSLEQFWSYWQSQNGQNYQNVATRMEQNCVLVNDRGEFIGFLDTCSLLKYLLSGTNNFENTPQNNLSEDRQLLFSLLERIPFPLSLETDRGIPLYHNLSWREKIERDRSQNSQDANLKNNDRYVLSNEQSQEIAIDLALERNKTISFEAKIDRSSRSENSQRWQFVKLPLELSGDRSLAESVLTLATGEKQFLSHHETEAKQDYGYSKNRNSFPNDSPTREAIEPKNSVWLILANEKTQQQTLDRELAAKNANISQLNRLKNELLASIGHELKSPLTAIVGLSNLLQDRQIGQLNQRQNRYAEQIYQSSRQLMNLVNQLLDLTALEAGQLKLSLESIEIKTICQRAIDAIAQKYGDKIDRAGVKLSLEIQTNLKAILADELRLEQMLVYLLETALTLSETGTEIGLRVEDFGSSWVAFTVWNDSKIGLLEDFQSLAFEQLLHFENLDLQNHYPILPERSEVKNTGLGLVMSKRLAKAQGGDVSFICRENKGNEFKLLLKANQNVATENVQTQSNLNRSRSILVVESISQQLENLTTKLTEFGFSVIVARSGIEAVSKAENFLPEIIFLNPNLPLLDGWEALRLLKLNVKTKDIPVFVTSKPLDRDLSVQNGADGFLSLPVGKKDLQRILLGQESQNKPQSKSLTILCLHGIPEKASCLSAIVDSQLNGLNHRIIEADCLEQAEILARIWKIDVIVIELNLLENPEDFLRSLAVCDSLATLPLVTIDPKTTEAANQIKGLSVFPCLVPLQDRGYSNLLEVIQIAAKIDS
ncbi:MAG: hybrid sensor histidine kinase/response regulator [Prochloraceae cyanobacterium]|nr:hybrid sensor histidine kinase/response regulator [Prochloraceae cyanobacterium]